MAALIHWIRVHVASGMNRLGPVRIGVLMVRFTGLIICLHMLQILLWAGFYRWCCFPSWGLSIYFSTSSYSSLGYGDVVLPSIWRNVGPVESVTGVLMCGVSASFVFAIVNRLVERESRFLSETEKPSVSVSASKIDS